MKTTYFSALALASIAAAPQLAHAQGFDGPSIGGSPITFRHASNTGIPISAKETASSTAIRRWSGSPTASEDQRAFRSGH